MRLDINTDAAVVFANKLERISKRELAYAVKVALDSAAFDVKKRTMPSSAAGAFVNRSKNFFKANSRVKPAARGNINSMQSEVGFVETGLKGSKNYAVKDLEQQESGGTIAGKSFIPTKKARTGNSSNRMVSSRNRLSGIKKVIDTRKLTAKNAKQAFKYGASKAGRGGHVLHNNMLFRIDSETKATALYSYQQQRKVRVNSTGFMKKAALISGERIEEHFIRAARKILNL